MASPDPTKALDKLRKRGLLDESPVAKRRRASARYAAEEYDDAFLDAKYPGRKGGQVTKKQAAARLHLASRHPRVGIQQIAPGGRIKPGSVR